MVIQTIIKDERLFVRPLPLIHDKKREPQARTDSKVQLSSQRIVASRDDPYLVAATGRVKLRKQ
jgi:hypothetical protein